MVEDDPPYVRKHDIVPGTYEIVPRKHDPFRDGLASE